MSRKFAKKFILSRCKKLENVPLSWNLIQKQKSVKYCLDMRLASVGRFKDQVGYAFDLIMYGEDSSPSVERRPVGESGLNDPFRNPELISKLDLSLNELTELTQSDLLVFPDLRSIDASLNDIHRFSGIGVAVKLVHLNLSYNNIENLPFKAISQCSKLKSLNLCANKLKSIANFPPMSDLVMLDLSFNEFENVDGVQRLRNLRKLFIHNNEIDSQFYNKTKNNFLNFLNIQLFYNENIVHISACLELTQLDASNNHLGTISDIAASVHPLKKLKQLCIKGNPVTNEVSNLEMQTVIAKASSVTVLDDTNISPLREQFNQFKSSEPPQWKDSMKVELKNAVRESMQAKAKKQDEKIHESIKYYQKKIHLLLRNQERFKDKIVLDTEAWCRYIETLSKEEVKSLTVSKIRMKALSDADGTFQDEKDGLDEPSTSIHTLYRADNQDL